MKVCPLRMHALESSAGNIHRIGNAHEVAEEDSEGLLKETIGCLEEHCAWWNGRCAILTMAILLDCIDDRLASILDSMPR